VATTVAYVAPWVTVGGSDKATVDWFRRLDRTRFSPILITTQSSDNELLPLLAEHAAEVHVLPDRMPGREMPAYVAELVESRDVRVMHVMNSRLGFDLLPALRDAFPRLATVVQMHAEEQGGAGYVRYVADRYDDVVDAYSVTNRDLGSRLVGYGIPERKIEVIHTGIDAEHEFTPGSAPELFPPQSPSGLEILYAARLDHEKDPLLMVRVARALADAGSSARVHVVGDGPLREAVRREAAALGVDDRVLLHGVSDRMRDWYRATDVVLLTSRFEGMPVVAFEAMACARPMVAPDVGGTRELVEDGVTRSEERRVGKECRSRWSPYH